MAVKKPWAILLCKWKGTTDEPETVDFFRRLFTRTGSGSSNMVDFFDAMSHGNVDASDSEVFGWFTLGKEQSSYRGNVSPAKLLPGEIERDGLVGLARESATANGVNLESYVGVVVCMNTLTDLFGGPGRALCDPKSFAPSALGQEMGHGYGLDHSRIDGSEEDYQDPWDVMSTFAAFMAVHPEYTLIGPGLNAANMRGRGWLDESRVWKGRGLSSTDTIELRTLHRRDLSGFLAAEIDGLDGETYLVELRTNAGWDAAIPAPVVLVHRFEGNRSYLMKGSGGRPELFAGDGFAQGNEKKEAEAYVGVEVLSIDGAGEKATLRVRRRPWQLEPPIHFFERLRDGFVDLVVTAVGGGGEVDGGGYILVGGRVVRVPVWNPMRGILKEIEAYQQAEKVPNADVQTRIRQRVLRSMSIRVAAARPEGDAPRPHVS